VVSRSRIYGARRKLVGRSVPS